MEAKLAWTDAKLDRLETKLDVLLAPQRQQPPEEPCTQLMLKAHTEALKSLTDVCLAALSGWKDAAAHGTAEKQTGAASLGQQAPKGTTEIWTPGITPGSWSFQGSNHPPLYKEKGR